MIAAAEPTAAAAPRIVPATRFAVALRLRVRAALACGVSGEDCGVEVVVDVAREDVDLRDPLEGLRALVLLEAVPPDDCDLLGEADAFFVLDFPAAEVGEDFLPPRLAALREGGGDFLPPRLAALREGGEDFLPPRLDALREGDDVRAADRRFFAAPVLRVVLLLREDEPLFADDFFADDFFAPLFADPFLEVPLEAPFDDVLDAFFEPAFFEDELRFEDDFFAPPLLLLPLLRFDLAAIQLALLWFHWRRQDTSCGSGAPMRVSKRMPVATRMRRDDRCGRCMFLAS